MSQERLSHFGVTFPTEFVTRLDRAKGPYYSRNKYIMKILAEHLDEKEAPVLEGPRLSIESPTATDNDDTPREQQRVTAADPRGSRTNE